MSAEEFSDLDQVVAAVQLVRQSVAAASIQTHSLGGRDWTWTMRVDGEVLAVPHRPYGRRVECLAGATRFRAAAAAADIDPRVRAAVGRAATG